MVPLFPSTSIGALVETCEELQVAFELTKTQDVEIEVHPYINIDCAAFTTMRMDSHVLTVTSSVAAGEDLTNFYGNGNADLFEVRFEVTNGAKLFWEPTVEFHGGSALSGAGAREVNDGAIFVGAGSTVRFMNDVTLSEFSITTGADTVAAGHSVSGGGCVYTDGYFRVDGKATFSNCVVVPEEGSGSGSTGGLLPGNGGALYVGEKGSVLFDLELDMSNNGIRSSGPRAFTAAINGGGIYNEGKINTKQGAVFNRLRATAGGAVYNAAGAQFRFRSFSRALFLECDLLDDLGSALYNRGFFEFDGPALYVENGAPAIYVEEGGETDLSSSKSSFFQATAIGSRVKAAIVVASGGSVDVDIGFGNFFSNADPVCGTVFFEEDETCFVEE